MITVVIVEFQEAGGARTTLVTCHQRWGAGLSPAPRREKFVDLGMAKVVKATAKCLMIMISPTGLPRPQSADGVRV